MKNIKHVIGKHGAVGFETKNGIVCAECNKPILWKPESPQKARKRLIKELDKVCSEMVLERDLHKCVNCGSTRALGASHYFSRRYQGTRWNLDNLCCLCWPCHRRWETDKQGIYTDFMVTRMGVRNYEMLKVKAYSLKPLFLATARAVAESKPPLNNIIAFSIFPSHLTKYSII